MKKARTRLILLLFLLIGLSLACSTLGAESPLPTLAVTADPPLRQATDVAFLPPTLSIATATFAAASAGLDNPPERTTTATSALSDARDRETILISATATVPPTSFPATNTLTATPAIQETVSIPTPTHLPPATATRPPPPPTATEIPANFPLPPDAPWPAPTPPDFPVSTVPRHGVGIALGGAPQGSYGPGPYSWQYTWTTYAPETPGPVEHIPMLSGGPRGGMPSRAIIEETDRRTPHDYWLVFNECEHQNQCNSSPQEAARFYHDEVVEVLFNQGADANARLIVGGVNAHSCGIQWLTQFVNYYQANYGALPHAGWHFHLYPEMHPGGWLNGNCDGNWGFNDTLFPDAAGAFNLWQTHAQNALEFVRQYGGASDQIWFTEMGCLNYGFHQQQRPICQAEGFMAAYAGRILNWLNGDGRWVTRYAWYTNWDRKYWRATHLLASVEGQRQYSALGWWYSQIQPAAAVPWQ